MAMKPGGPLPMSASLSCVKKDGSVPNEKKATSYVCCSSINKEGSLPAVLLRLGMDLFVCGRASDESPAILPPATSSFLQCLCFRLRGRPGCARCRRMCSSRRTMLALPPTRRRRLRFRCHLRRSLVRLHPPSVEAIKLSCKLKRRTCQIEHGEGTSLLAHERLQKQLHMLTKTPKIQGSGSYT